MSSPESRLLLDVWDAVRELVPPPKREEASLAILRAFVDHGCDAHDLAEAKEDDEDLAIAFDDLFGTDEEEKETDEEEE